MPWLAPVRTIANDAHSHFSVTLQNDVFDAETGGISIAYQTSASFCALDLATGTAIEIVCASNFPAENTEKLADLAFGTTVYAFALLAVGTIWDSRRAVGEIGIDCVLGECHGR